MCGRFALRATAEEIILHFKLTQSFSMQPRYNIAPTQKIPVICSPGKIEFLDWGFKPKWMNKKHTTQGFFNARAETVMEKPAFKEAFHHRRCLILSDGFYEWKTIGTKKQPFFITPSGGELFAFAGLWEEESAVILTTAASPSLSDIHERMPLIIDKNHYLEWLKPHPLSDYQNVLKSNFSFFWKINMVSTKVNSTKFDFPECVQPLQ